MISTDVLIIGGGLAGLWAALHLPEGWDAVVVDKGAEPGGGSSPWAQGGMAVAVGPDDSPELHAADTIRAGAGACSAAAVAVLCEEAPAALDELVGLGCVFDRGPDGSFDLNHEGGQSVARSVHAADATGREIMRAVVERVRSRATRVLGSVLSIDVAHGRCVGATVAVSGEVVAVRARTTLLATGGCGALYASTTNPAAATGDGVALGYEAGAEVSDLEFVQFHPTALAVGGHRRLLLTEALRGDGAVVVDEHGERFLADVHPDAELAPRDVVARAIAARGGAWLDARPIGTEAVRARYPNICAAAAEHGFDLATQPVPVAPAAHYFLGGVVSDTDGRTTLPGLYAAGECATTGLHGANRMAGNSLSEALVFGRRTALAIAREAQRAQDAPAAELRIGADDPAGWHELRAAMTAGAGLERTAAGLAEARAVATATADAARGDRLRLAAIAAELITRAATARDESRGVHFRTDHPAPTDGWEGAHVTMRTPLARGGAKP